MTGTVSVTVLQARLARLTALARALLRRCDGAEAARDRALAARDTARQERDEVRRQARAMAGERDEARAVLRRVLLAARRIAHERQQLSDPAQADAICRAFGELLEAADRAHPPASNLLAGWPPADECIVPGCGRPAGADGWCRPHAQRRRLAAAPRATFTGPATAAAAPLAASDASTDPDQHPGEAADPRHPSRRSDRRTRGRGPPSRVTLG